MGGSILRYCVSIDVEGLNETTKELSLLQVSGPEIKNIVTLYIRREP